MRKTITILFIFNLFFSVCLAEGKPDYTPQEGYTTDLLKEPIYTEVEIAIRSTKMNNWLNEYYEKLTSAQTKNVREDLYYMISSHAKNLYQQKKKILPDQPDIILDILLSWADRLGVYGGAEVFTHVRTTDFPMQKDVQITKLPDFLSLEMKNDLIKVTAKREGWEFEIPYYFMIPEAKQFTATNGMKTQLLIISTGASKDTSKFGYSQATIMLIYSPDAEASSFSEYWQKMIGLKDYTEERKVNIRNKKSFYIFDEKLNLHKELIFLRGLKGSFAISYMGNDGTYQWNRPHFIDFLRVLKINQE